MAAGGWDLGQVATRRRHKTRQAALPRGHSAVMPHPTHVEKRFAQAGLAWGFLGGCLAVLVSFPENLSVPDSFFPLP